MTPICRQTFAALCRTHADTKSLDFAGRLVYAPTHIARDRWLELHEAGPIVLLTHGSDLTVDASLLRRLPPNVLHWFTVNCGVVDPRVTALPIGLCANRPTDQAVVLLNSIASTPRASRGLCYLNAPWDRLWGVYADERVQLKSWAHDKSWIFTEDRCPQPHFYQQLRSYDYVLCPRGAGPDTHRLTECLMLGAIPIVRSCTAMRHFAGWPILFVHAWEQVTEQLLRASLPELLRKFDRLEQTLTADYWTDQILNLVGSL